MFLTLDDVLRIHAEQIEKYGGDGTILSMELIESAIAQPQATYGGAYLHSDVAAMAAAYLFHLAKNHGFADGNKRTAIVAAIVFLAINDVRMEPMTQDELEQFAVDVTTGAVNKDRAAQVFRDRITV